MNMDVMQLQAEIAQFAKDRDWEKFHTVKNLVLALVGEAGELAAVVQWIENVDKEYLDTHPNIHQELADELADVFIYLLRISDVADINLVKVAQEKMIKNASRYTLEKSKGNADKQK